MTETSPRTVLELIQRSEANNALTPAVLGTGMGERLTYGELLGAVSDLASELRVRGIGPADAVLVSLPNGPSMLTAILGTMCAAACAPMNPAYTRSELNALADQLRPKALVTERGSSSPAALLAEERGLPSIEFDGLRVVRSSKEHAAPPDPAETSTALVLHTAGTTAMPKQVPLTHANLVAAARNVVASLQLSPADRCLNVMPLFHSHGLLGAALSTLHAGASIVCTPGMDPRRFLEWAASFGCTWYTAASTVHQLVLRAPGEWKGLRFMRSASGPLVPQVAVELERRFGAPMIEVYGMTEAYQIAANPLPPGERRLGTVGRPTGTEVGVLGDDEAVSTAGGEGEIVVRGPAVFGGYSSPGSANTDAFVDGWFRTGDLGRISEDGYLNITGRVKEQINRGGEKISPREVEESLLDHPDVVDAMAFAIPDPELGEEIGVALVVREGATVDVMAVRTYLHGRISPFKIPRRVVLTDQIPVSSTGKPQRLAFARQFAGESADAEPPGAVPVGADASTEARLASMWREVIGLDEPPSPEDGFFQLGGTSLAAMELVVRIEEELGVDLPMLDLLEVPALGALATRVDQLRSSDGSAPLLRHYRKGSGEGSLVLIPGQFGMAVGLNLIADAVDADVDLYLFDYPGHRPGQVPLQTIDELACCLVDELNDAGITRDVALYGNSMGGWVAFEAGRRLTEEGRPPRFVAIGDMYSPYFASKSSPLRPSLPRRVRNRLRRAAHQARDRWRMRQADRRSPAIARQEAVTAASAHASRQYDARPYTGDLLVVAASEREPKFGATLGWEHHSSGSIRTLRVAGGHGAMHRDQARPIGEALSLMYRSDAAANAEPTPRPIQDI